MLALVVDVKPTRRFNDPTVAFTFEWTRYEVLVGFHRAVDNSHAPESRDPNTKWMHLYRHVIRPKRESLARGAKPKMRQDCQ